MKLEDIKLQLGDKITFNDGIIAFVNSWTSLDIENYDKDIISKIERYVETPIMTPTKDRIEFYPKNTFRLETIYERKEILDKKEKEYLSNVIRPFRDKIYGIKKKKFNNKFEYIVIMLIDEDNMIFPVFKMNRMYKGMKQEKEYKLEELGL